MQKYYEPDPRFESDCGVRGGDGVEGRLQGVLISRLVYGSATILLLHCKKSVAIFPSPAGMSLTKLSLAGNNYYYYPGWARENH
jgi:hypothetical protein